MGIEELLADNGIEEEVVETPPAETPPAPQTDEPPVQEEEVSESAPVADVPPVEVPEEDPREREVRELKQMLRESKREMLNMKTALGKVQQKPQLDEDGEEIPQEVGRIEQLQNAIAAVGSQKSAILDVLVETMEMSPKYEDVRQVCTKSNFDDIFETAAMRVSRETGKPFEEALLEVELSVWKMSNPYKYMYGVIKQYHPRYAAQQQTAAPKAKEVVKQSPPAPSSISAVGGGDGGAKSGWTSAKLDAMDLDELEKVPANIYEQYLAGTLK